MWANAQRDGRLAQCIWRPLFNAVNFNLRPLLECRAVTLPTAKMRNPLKFAVVPQTRQQISADSGPKFTTLWGHIEETLLFNKFFYPIVDICLSCEDLAAKNVYIVYQPR